MGLSQPLKHLTNKSILLTRTAEQNQTTAMLVSAKGATPLPLACTHIQPLTNNIHLAWKQLQAAGSQATHVIFSSRNGVEAVVNTIPDFAQTLATYTVVSVGSKTNIALAQYGIKPEWTATAASQKGLIQSYQTQNLSKIAFFFRAETGADCLLNYLEKHGVQTQLVHAYRAEIDHANASSVIQSLKQDNVDAVLLGSARTAEFYVAKIGDIQLANKPIIAVMSQQVRKAADKLGLSVQITAEEPSFESMLQGLNDYFARHEKG